MISAIKWKTTNVAFVQNKKKEKKKKCLDNFFLFFFFFGCWIIYNACFSPSVSVLTTFPTAFHPCLLNACVIHADKFPTILQCCCCFYSTNLKEKLFSKLPCRAMSLEWVTIENTWKNVCGFYIFFFCWCFWKWSNFFFLAIVLSSINRLNGFDWGKKLVNLKWNCFCVPILNCTNRGDDGGFVFR